MTTVYLVSSGSYSDYRIEKAFSTRKKAQAWIRLHKVDKYDYDIEPIEVDSLEDLELIKRGMRLWFCTKATRGIGWIVDAGVSVRPAADDAVETEPTVEEYVLLGYDTEMWEVTVLAPNAEKARKIAADKIAQAQAEREGIV